MPEIATQAEDDAPVGAPEGAPQPADQGGVEELYKGFKKEHPSSKVTLQQFQQILAMRRKELEELTRKEKPDTSHIKINDAVVHKAADSVAAEARKNVGVETARRVEQKLETKKKAARLMAQLHQALPAAEQAEMMVKCRCALKDNPPTLPMHDFANFVTGMCCEHLSDEEEEALDLQLAIRGLFSEMLAVPIDHFDVMRGGIPRRLLAHQMLRRRRADALLRKEKGLDDEPEVDGEGEGARRGAAVRGEPLDSVCEEEKDPSSQPPPYTANRRPILPTTALSS
ncbi:hypothetical protein T484DRAFT_1921858 [Baffinella frigidus]|nr:hypothetical protein T484DRAFT_1921858 [Cryptophyta sp. CCMP2293]